MDEPGSADLQVGPTGSIGGAGGIGGLVLGETSTGIHGVEVDGNGNVTTLFDATTGSVTGEFD